MPRPPPASLPFFDNAFYPALVFKKPLFSLKIFAPGCCTFAHQFNNLKNRQVMLFYQPFTSYRLQLSVLNCSFYHLSNFTHGI